MDCGHGLLEPPDRQTPPPPTRSRLRPAGFWRPLDGDSQSGEEGACLPGHVRTGRRQRGEAALEDLPALGADDLHPLHQAVEVGRLAGEGFAVGIAGKDRSYFLEWIDPNGDHARLHAGSPAPSRHGNADGQPRRQRASPGPTASSWVSRERWCDPHRGRSAARAAGGGTVVGLNHSAPPRRHGDCRAAETSAMPPHRRSSARRHSPSAHGPRRDACSGGE